MNKQSVRKAISIVTEIAVFVGMFLLQFGTLGFSTANLISSIGTLVTTYVASLLIASTEYNNGTLMGKESDNYKTAQILYNQKAKLDGEKKLALSEFCSQYTKDLLETGKREIVEDACIRYEHFNEKYVDKNGNEYIALKLMRKKQLVELLGKEKAKAVIHAKKYKVEPLRKSDLLNAKHSKSNVTTGDDEDTLKRRNMLSNAITFFFFALFNSIFVIVGTHGITLASFGLFLYQCAVIISRGIASRYKAYHNVTVNLVSRFARQCDYIDEFECWYAKRQVNNGKLE